MTTPAKTAKTVDEISSLIGKQNLDSIQACLVKNRLLSSTFDNKQCATLLAKAINCIQDSDKRYDIVNLLLQSGIGNQLIKSENDFPSNIQAPLHAASDIGDPRLVRLLIEHGANPDILNEPNGWTALLLACHSCPNDDLERQKNYLEVIRILGASQSDLEFMSRSRLSALSVAARRQLFDAVKLLCSLGANPNSAIGMSYGAVYDCSIDIMKILLATGQVNMNRALQSLMNSPCIRHPDKVGDWGRALAMLLESGANPDELGNGGINVIHLVASYGSPDMVDLLVSHGADIHFHRNYVTTPLMRAVRRNTRSPHMLGVLLKYNCNMFATTKSFHTKTRNTAFLVAYRDAHFDAVQCLIGAGYKVDDESIHKSFSTGSPRKVFCPGQRHKDIYVTPDAEFVDWYRAYTTKPRSLKHNCRLRIREVLGTSLHRNLCADESLPKSIRSYLYFDDL